jgi:hypothetical protein
MKRVPAVTQVRVSLKDGLTILDLKPGNSTTLAQLRQIIKHNGFVPKEAAVVARGAVVADDVFVVNGTNERLQLSGPAERKGEDWTLAVQAPASRAQR